MAGMSKEELVTVIKANSQLGDEQIADLSEKIKGSMMEELNEKLAELTKKEDNKMKQVDPVVEAKDKEPAWKSFGEQLHAVMLAGTPNGSIDKRLVDTKAISGSSELIGADGGYTRVAHIKSCYMLETPKIFTTPIGVTM